MSQKMQRQKSDNARPEFSVQKKTSFFSVLQFCTRIWLKITDTSTFLRPLQTDHFHLLKYYTYTNCRVVLIFFVLEYFFWQSFFSVLKSDKSWFSFCSFKRIFSSLEATHTCYLKTWNLSLAFHLFALKLDIW